MKPSQSKWGKGPLGESPVVSHQAEAFTGLGHLKGESESQDSGEFKAFSMHSSHSGTVSANLPTWVKDTTPSCLPRECHLCQEGTELPGLSQSGRNAARNKESDYKVPLTFLWDQFHLQILL